MQQNFLNGTDKLKNYEEQNEVVNDIMNSSECKQYLIVTRSYNFNVQDFINDAMNRYKNKEELKNYYFPNIKDDRTWQTQIESLWLLERIILKYVLIKYDETRLKQ